MKSPQQIWNEKNRSKVLAAKKRYREKLKAQQAIIIDVLLALPQPDGSLKITLEGTHKGYSLKLTCSAPTFVKGYTEIIRDLLGEPTLEFPVWKTIGLLPQEKR